jgi:hypothetical protein
MDPLRAATIAGEQLKPRTYEVIVDEITFTLEHNVKVVAEVPESWKEGPDK